jgi:DnaK suppressor protein
MTALPPPSDSRNIRSTLEQQRAELLTRLQDDLRETCALTGQLEDTHDLFDMSAVTAESDIRVSLMSTRTATLVAIDAALERLGEGLYGRCDSCSQPIGAARLRVVPFALRCTHCEEAKEAAERARRTGGTDIAARRLW